MEYENRGFACCFTGHRGIPRDDEERIRKVLEEEIRKLIDGGYTDFWSGGAVGFDILSGMAVLQAKQFHEDIRLILVLPCRNQTERWMRVKSDSAMHNLQTYQHLKNQAESILYLNDFYVDGCMRERNARMVTMSSHCVAYWNGCYIGGTAQTVRMAQKENIPVTNLWQPTAKPESVQ